jgi:N-acetylglucosaminyldiphosphoundecaprenol N-acetyl-beta-D-mannosaminyltransferase
MNAQQLINFPITTGPYQSFVSRLIALGQSRTSAVVCVANVHMFVEAQQNADFLHIIKNATMVTPDGKPLTWALRLLYGVQQDRVAGMDLLPDLLQNMMEKNLSVYFYGGSQTMLDATKTFVQNKYPALSIAGMFSPPFRALSIEEEQKIIHQINETKPHVVFVVLGCPKQEKWMAAMKDKVNAVMIGVGGALPVMIGLQKRAPVWMQNAGLEWLYRLLQEPGRLFKRYAVTNSIFIFKICKAFLKIKILTPLKITKA